VTKLLINTQTANLGMALTDISFPCLCLIDKGFKRLRLHVGWLDV
jgi:hypothetical protein